MGKKSNRNSFCTALTRKYHVCCSDKIAMTSSSVRSSAFSFPHPAAGKAIETHSSMDEEEQKKIKALPRVDEVGRFWSVKALAPKPLSRLRQIHRWFSDQVISSLLMPLTRQEDRLSLRALDWLVTNYAKKHNIVLADETTMGPPLNVYSDYRSMLTYWRRRNFDPFRRHQRIYFMWKDPMAPKDSPPVIEETTVGQLNFLHWASISGIIRYARNNVAKIEEDMGDCMSESKALKKQDKLKGVKRKRRELSQAPGRCCYVYPVKTQVDLEPKIQS